MTAIQAARNVAARAKRQRRAGDQDAAVEMLRSTLGPLEADLASGDEAAAGELADVLGQIGGALREKDDLVEAAAAYDAGFGYEVRYALPNTYNALNRIVTRIFLCPDALANPDALRHHDELPWIDLRAETVRLHGVLSVRDDGDQWTVGDLALTAALSGIDLGDALERLANEVGPAVRGEYLPIVERLAGLDTPRRTDLERLAHALG